MNFAFAGYKHGHTGAMYHEAAEHPDINILGAWEDSDAGRQLADGTGICLENDTLSITGNKKYI